MRKCFFVTPIGDEGSEIRKKCDDVYDNAIVPALGQSYNVLVAHKICRTGDINSDVINHIRNDDLVVVNLTGLNRNVLFELGIRYGLNKPFILIAENGTKLPFDIDHERTFFYSPDSDDYTALIRKLKTVEKSISYNNSSSKLKKYVGRWLEIIFDFTDRPVAICRLSYNKNEGLYKLKGHNYHYCDQKNDVYFESNIIIDTDDKRSGFYYITHPTIIDNITGFGEIHFSTVKHDMLTVAKGYFVDISSEGKIVGPVRKTRMIKCDKSFLKYIGLENRQLKSVSDSDIVEHSKEFLKKKHGIEVNI